MAKEKPSPESVKPLDPAADAPTDNDGVMPTDNPQEGKDPGGEPTGAGQVTATEIPKDQKPKGFFYTREIHGHEGNPANESIILVADDLGNGGASHVYEATLAPWPDDPEEIQTLGVIRFQDGAIGEAGVNGLTHEILLATLDDRLACFQAGDYACPENEEALYHVRMARNALQKRTDKRKARGVEGTHTV